MPEPLLAAGTKCALKALGIVVPEGEKVHSCRRITEADGEATCMETDNYVYVVSEDCSTAIVQRKNAREKRGDGATYPS